MTWMGRDRDYGLGVLALCLAATLLAFADDEDNSWMFVIAALAALATALTPGGLATAQRLRSRPHAWAFWLSLMIVAAAGGINRVPAELWVGVSGVLAATYVLALAVSHSAGGRQP